MVRKKGSSKSTSKKVVKAKNSHHKNVLESVFGPPKRATLKQTIEPSSKHTMKLRNDYSKKTKPKRNQLAAAVNRQQGKKTKRSRPMQQQQQRQQQQNNQQKRQKRKAPRSNNSVRKFKLKLPTILPNSPPVPWWTKSLSLQYSSSSGTQQQQQQQQQKLLETISVQKETLQHLNAELQAFCDYVRLTPAECHVREHIIESIRNLSSDLFEIAPEQCRLFGSFAARPVCTFESDIDLAIFGVVEPDDEEEDDGDGDDQDDVGEISSGVEPKSLPPPEHPNRKKRERVLKWKALLDEADQMQSREGSIDGNGESTSSKASVKSAQHVPAPKGEFDSGEDPTLFVIDTEGPMAAISSHSTYTKSVRFYIYNISVFRSVFFIFI